MASPERDCSVGVEDSDPEDEQMVPLASMTVTETYEELLARAAAMESLRRHPAELYGLRPRFYHKESQPRAHGMGSRKRPLVELDPETLAKLEKKLAVDRASRWHHFLYHVSIPAQVVIAKVEKIYGEAFNKACKEHVAARQKFKKDPGSLKITTINAMEKFLIEYAYQPGNKINPLEMKKPPSVAELQKWAHGSWSPENFFRVWAYMRGFVDYDKSSPLGQYYMRTMFQGLAMEIADYILVKKHHPELGAARRSELHDFYFAMPKMKQFSEITKGCFAEIFERAPPGLGDVKRQRRDSSVAAEEESLARFETDELPPPSSSKLSKDL